MKQIEKVSIGGYAFMLDKDASDKVGQYISELEAHYLTRAGGKEVMEGIEERIAELLLERCGKDRVASSADVQYVIDIIGKPEKIEEDDPDEPAQETEKPRKKLFRDMENKRLGGVCAGLAAYFGGDVAVWRLVFTLVTLVIFFGGASHGVWSLFGGVVYAILWVAMPPANTARERWAMKGDNGTADDIVRNIETGAKEMGAAAEKVVKSDGFKSLFRIFLVIIGFALLIAGSSGLAAVTALSFGGSTLFGGQIQTWLNDLSQAVPGYMDLLATPWIFTLVVLAVVLPLIALIWGGVQLIFNFKEPSWRPGLVIFVLWLMVLVALVVVSVMFGISTGALFWA
jgi:phage shock protein PspC (stress-responsive transcriptional regulator)